jgi:hypothetical protein
MSLRTRKASPSDTCPMPWACPLYLITSFRNQGQDPAVIGCHSQTPPDWSVQPSGLARWWTQVQGPPHQELFGRCSGRTQERRLPHWISTLTKLSLADGWSSLYGIHPSSEPTSNNSEAMICPLKCVSTARWWGWFGNRFCVSAANARTSSTIFVQEELAWDCHCTTSTPGSAHITVHISSGGLALIRCNMGPLAFGLLSGESFSRST